MMSDKKLIPILDLDSTDFEEKVSMSLRETGYINISYMNVNGRDKAVDNFLFLLMNSRLSQRKSCRSCGSYHWVYTKDFESGTERDKFCLCSSCANILNLMIMFDTPPDRIKAWMISKGVVNPLREIKDAVEELIKKGKIKFKGGSVE